ncbi:MAG: hypothetical protein B5766_01190 [Candidatus Lumbricidophila eiseniae]|uniref:Uncharacterized protein n=1 Tax=Candidatus Lumbricidiphila eiseniae TaxID=1969409 RepID=A0A2A6FU01_9MICO|nr:MAG: hypothetical protein B5766_01190 [Candidatus Lumbricidophila eiseniae]
MAFTPHLINITRAGVKIYVSVRIHDRPNATPLVHSAMSLVAVGSRQSAVGSRQSVGGWRVVCFRVSPIPMAEYI